MDNWSEAVQSIRAFTWNRTIRDEDKFVHRWLVKLRSAFRGQFAFATLSLREKTIEASSPENTCELDFVSQFINSFFDDFSTSKVPTVVEDIRLRWGFRSLMSHLCHPQERDLQV